MTIGLIAMAGDEKQMQKFIAEVLRRPNFFPFSSIFLLSSCDFAWIH